MRSELDFDRLVDLYYGPLFRFAVSLTQTESDAADLTQETFRVWAVKGHQLQDPTKAKSWLFTTLHRLFLEIRRRQTRFPNVDLESTLQDLPVVDPVSTDRLDAANLWACLKRLDDQFQAAVALFYLEDCSYKEIAEILEVPLGTVKSRIARGLTQLKALLAQETSKPRTPSQDV